jgi:hypothetical protein
VKKIVAFILLVIACQLVFAVTAPPFYGYKAPDGTRVQVYYTKKVTVTGGHKVEAAILVPMWIDTLSEDYFWLYMEFPDPDPRNILLTLHEQETVQITYQDNDGQWQQKEEERWIEISRHSLDLHNGKNPHADYKYAEVKIDSTQWPDFKTTDVLQQVIVHYLDWNLTFYHHTDPGIVPVVQTRGELQSRYLYFIAIETISFIAFTLFFAYLFKKMAGIWMGFNIVPIAAITGWLAAVGIAWYFAQQMTGADISRQIVTTPLEVVIISLTALITIWIPAIFREKPVPVYIFKLKWPDNIFKLLQQLTTTNIAEAAKLLADNILDMDVLQIDRVKGKDGKNRYFNDADSPKEFIGQLFHGDMKIINLDQVIVKEKKHENDAQLIVKEKKDKDIMLVGGWRYLKPDIKGVFQKELFGHAIFTLRWISLYATLLSFISFVFCYVLQLAFSNYENVPALACFQMAFDAETLRKLQKVLLEEMQTRLKVEQEKAVLEATIETRIAKTLGEFSSVFITFVQKNLYGWGFLKDKDAVKKKIEQNEMFKEFEKKYSVNKKESEGDNDVNRKKETNHS